MSELNQCTRDYFGLAMREFDNQLPLHRHIYSSAQIFSHHNSQPCGLLCLGEILGLRIESTLFSICNRGGIECHRESLTQQDFLCESSTQIDCPRGCNSCAHLHGLDLICTLIFNNLINEEIAPSDKSGHDSNKSVNRTRVSRVG